MSAIYAKENFPDFFPNPGYYYDKAIHDSTTVDKLCWYFSQITHHTLLLLFSYFFLALINRKSELYFKMVAPLALTISSHFMIIFLVIGEFMYIKQYSFEETTHCFIFILTCLCSILINYTLRGVWSYNLVKLDQYKGWYMVGLTTLVMYFFSLMFFFLKNRKSPFYGIKTEKLWKYIPFFSSLGGIIVFLFVS